MKRGTIWILFFLMVGIGSGFPESAFSETETRQTAVYTLGEVVVTGAGSTRLRVVEPLPAGFPGRLIIGGRQETLQNGHLKWKGFLQQVIFESGTLFPCSKPIILDKDRETRVRTMDIFKNSLITAGFTEDKTKASTAFVSIYPLK